MDRVNKQANLCGKTEIGIKGIMINGACSSKPTVTIIYEDGHVEGCRISKTVAEALIGYGFNHGS